MGQTSVQWSAAATSFNGEPPRCVALLIEGPHEDHPTPPRNWRSRSSRRRSRPTPDQGLLRGHVCCAIALYTSWIGVPATIDGSESAAAALLSCGIGQHSSRRTTGASNVLAGAQAGNAMG
nr:uncharacterized protein LOC127297403 [Lolium perenne]